MSKKLGRKKREEIEFNKWEKELFANKSTDFNTDEVSVPDDEADKFDNDKFLKEQAAEDALHYKDNDDKYYRFFKIPYSENDAIIAYKKFKYYSSKAFNLRSSQKINRFIKKFKWWDYYYIELFLRKGIIAKSHKSRIEKRNLLFTLNQLSNFEVQLNNNEYTHYQNELRNQVEKVLSNANSDYIKAFYHWVRYLSIQYFYKSVAVDSSVKPICDSMIKFSNELENEDFKSAAKTFSEYFHSWWD